MAKDEPASAPDEASGLGLLQRTVEPYSNVFLVLSPPRCSSTAFARTLWEHDQIRYYSHEPFELTYFDGAGLDVVADKLAQPLDLCDAYKGRAVGAGLVIKEMPYQVGRHAATLIALATAPVVFLIRDPRLAVQSRMRKKSEVGDDPHYPLIESGWELLLRQIDHCREHSVPYLIVDATDFRTRPDSIFRQVFERLGLEYSPDLLGWRSGQHIEIDNLDGRHRHLYERVLRSRGIEPPVEEVPPLDSFPIQGRWREHVEWCLGVYRELRESPERVRATPSAGRATVR